MSASAAAAAPSVPANAVGDAKIQSVPAPAATSQDRQAAIIALARAGQRAEAEQAAGATPSAPTGDAAKPSEPAAKVEDGAKPKDPPAHTVTQRIADLTRKNRELAAAAQAAEARATAVTAAMEEAKKGGTQLEAVKAAFKSDPLKAFEMLGEGWADIVNRVASGGLPPTPEQVAAAERERVETARDARLKRLEEERDAKAAKETEERVARETEGATKYIAEKMITAEKHPHLIGIAADAAVEALEQVAEALKLAHKEGRRKSPDPESLEEAQALTSLALDGLQNYYRDFAGRLVPVNAAQQSAAAPAAPAAQAAPAVIAESASQQHRPINTITHAAAGAESPPAVQPKRMTSDEAQALAMERARRLPPL